MSLIDGLKETSRREIMEQIDSDQKARVARMLEKVQPNGMVHMETATPAVSPTPGPSAAPDVRPAMVASKDAKALVACHYCGRLDRPIYLGGEGAHICGDCWLESHKNDPPDNPMPWEVGS